MRLFGFNAEDVPQNRKSWWSGRIAWRILFIKQTHQEKDQDKKQDSPQVKPQVQVAEPHCDRELKKLIRTSLHIIHSWLEEVGWHSADSQLVGR